jgi:zeaxanthin glucosyltransferase
VTLLLISPDYASHALPLVTLAGAWQAAGERVVVATGPAVASIVTAAGMEHVDLVFGRGSNAGIARPERQPPGEEENLRRFFAATRQGMVATLRYQADARASDLLWQPVEAARRTLAVVDEIQPDRILVDHLAFGPTIGLRAQNVPYVDVVLGHPRQLPVNGEVYGVPSAWPAAIVADLRELRDLEATARGVGFAFTAAYNDALRAVSPGAEPVHDAFAAHGPTVLFNYPAPLHDSRRTALLPSEHVFLGAVSRGEDPSPLVSEWLERHADRELVLVSLGTFLSARADVLATIVAGLRQLDVRVALATGSADPARLGPLPTDWLVAPYLPQVAILERASALVTHAGNNSVTEAIAAGVPMFALPFSTDQFDGAAAIELAGLGRAADPNRLRPSDVEGTVDRLLQAPHPVLDWLAADIAVDPGPQRALRWLATTRATIVEQETGRGVAAAAYSGA